MAGRLTLEVDGVALRLVPLIEGRYKHASCEGTIKISWWGSPANYKPHVLSCSVCGRLVEWDYLTGEIKKRRKGVSLLTKLALGLVLMVGLLMVDVAIAQAPSQGCTTQIITMPDGKVMVCTYCPGGSFCT